MLLFDGGKEILADFGDQLSTRAAKELKRLGVEIRCGSRVTGLDGLGADVEGPDGSVERIESRTKVWAAGVQASPLAALLATATGADCDRPGRIEVLPDCSLPGHPEVFAVGDMMSLDQLPGVAEVAMQSGIHAANTIKRRLHGKDSVAVQYHDLGSMATISRFRAIVSFKGDPRLSGFLGWLMWLFVHVAFLTGFKNRFVTVVSWGLTFISRNRSERTLTFQEVRRQGRDRGGGGATLPLRLTTEEPAEGD